MDKLPPNAKIPESIFHYRLNYLFPWLDRWVMAPNPFLAAMLPMLADEGVELADYSFSSDNSNLADISLLVQLKKWRSEVRITLASVTFIASNPNWQDAPKLLDLFDRIARKIEEVAGSPPGSRDAILAFHATCEAATLRTATSAMVNASVVGAADLYGFTRYRQDQVLTIEKSLKYANGMFVRLQRTFQGIVSSSEIAIQLLDDELEALKLLGLSELP